MPDQATIYVMHCLENKEISKSEWQPVVNPIKTIIIMGQEYSKPQPGITPRVIAAGLPRTGTASLCRALEILLDGPIYHGGTQVTLGPEVEIKTWMKILSQWPPRDRQAREENLKLIRARLDGFAAVADSPCCNLVDELMTLYPDAKVICTVRDVGKWEQSMQKMAGTATIWFLRFVFFPLPALRFWVGYIDRLRDQWETFYAESTEPPTRKIYEKHIDWLKENVPAEKLVFLQVKDGWEPLCKALDVPVPKDVPFPHVNDGDAIDSFAQKCILKGLRAWLGIAVVGVASTVLAVRFSRTT